MESEDLDQFVERCAAKFLSDDYLEVLNGSQMLKQAHASDDETEFARKAQELAVFRGGSVLKVLIARVADFIKEPGKRAYTWLDDDIPSQIDEKASPDSDGSGPNMLMLPSMVGLLQMSASKVVVECLMKDASNAGMLAKEFEFNISLGLETLFSEKGEAGKTPPVYFREIGLNGLVNFSRSSRVFREALRQLPNLATLFKNLEFVCTTEVLDRLADVERIEALKVLVTSLMVSLSFAHLTANFGPI